MRNKLSKNTLLVISWFIFMSILWWITGKNWQLRQNMLFGFIVLFVTFLVILTVIYFSRHYLKSNIQGVKKGIIVGFILSVVISANMIFAAFFAYAPPWGYITNVLLGLTKVSSEGEAYLVMIIVNFIVLILLSTYGGAFIYSKRKKKSKKQK